MMKAAVELTVANNRNCTEEIQQLIKVNVIISSLPMMNGNDYGGYVIAPSM